MKREDSVCFYLTAPPSAEVSSSGKCSFVLTVGRKDADVVLESFKDKSVSRAHAELHITYDTKGAGAGPNSGAASQGASQATKRRAMQLGVVDVSKFGTSVDGAACSKDKVAPTSVPARRAPASSGGGDAAVSAKILFGAHPGGVKFQLAYETVMLCVSTSMVVAERKKLEAVSARMGWRVTSKWSAECTHLVSDTFGMTHKSAMALLNGCPVVQPSWAHAFAARAGLPDPPPAAFPDFSPPLAASIEEGLKLSLKVSLCVAVRHQLTFALTVN